MARLPDGDIVAATIPGGTIHRVSTRGKLSTFATLDVEQIWDLLVHRDRLLVATGPKGELFSLSLEGKDAKVILDVSEKDLLSLLAVKQDIVVGTAPRAKLFQVSDDLEGTLLHDFAGDEVRDLALTSTGLVVAVNEFKDRSLSSVDALTKTLNRTSLVGQPPTGSISGGSTPKAEATVYHVNLGAKLDLARASEASWEKWLHKDKQYFSSLLALDGKGTVLVASSSGGKIYRVRGVRDVATVADLEERQITSLCRLETGPVIATAGDSAAVYRLQAAPAAKARYRSKIFDATQPASFGTVRMRGVGPISLRARSGPSEEPDKRWTDWKKIALASGDGGLHGSLAGLERRRYVQLEVQLGNKAAVLRDLELFYAPENLAPVLQSIKVEAPDFDDDDDDEPDPKLTIEWKVDARDDDDLVYEVRVRPEGADSSQWIKLHPDDELVTKKELKWDVTTVPDGVYEVGVVASDAPSNGTAKARTDELVSAPVIVDRRRPVIENTSVAGDRVLGRARDDGNHIHDVSFSLNGGPFQAASASDGLFDEKQESFELVLPRDLRGGRHRLVLRARDAAGNIGTVAIVISR